MAFVGSFRACYRPFVPAQVSDICDNAALNVLKRTRRVPVRIPGNSSDPEVGISYAEFGQTHPGAPTIVLIHGFDSSLVEYRRLAPLLDDFRVLLIDLHGWGFTEKPRGLDYGPESKRLYAISTIQKLVNEGEKVYIGGASLGGGAALDLAHFRPDLFKGIILIDAQAYVEGSPGSSLIWPLDVLGIQVLKAKFLRRFASVQSYYNSEKFATEDAMLVGRLPCLTDGWFEANLDFLKSDGYRNKSKVKEISQEALIIWGRQDKILSVESVDLFKEDLGERLVSCHILEECGHMPHLEKPDETAELIRKFVHTIEGKEQPSSVVDEPISSQIDA
ncbi:hypothetical protein NDN08_003215 [Rhodosorus marinus]|uniref:AB hydrolase-1 domain-containing protein n=1 Tax=Rhodosorus marinus TaxID=101924 RepID=A0AAV8UVV5_9RHOD|nr:hypothetical protein NDN08_003215 [Rhodosorus marinus]